MLVERPDRALFAMHLAESPWEDAMRWIAAQPIDTHVLADPGHAWKYGTSVRVSAERDVFLEDVKDSAIAIYSRDVALRYTERMRASATSTSSQPQRARDLAARYDLDYLVAEADLRCRSPIATSSSRCTGRSGHAGHSVGARSEPAVTATAAASRSGARGPCLRRATRRTP